MANWFINIGFTPIGIVSSVIFIILIVYPVSRILVRLQMSGWFAIIAAIPFVSIIALWFLAFIRWPTDKKKLDSNELVETERKIKKLETIASDIDDRDN